LLVAKNLGFFVPSPKQRQQILVEFARRGYAIYGSAFDIVKTSDPKLLEQGLDVVLHFDSLTLCEVKSTNRKIGNDWKGYFFSLSTAELLIAQSLQGRFRFLLVNTTTGEFLEETLVGLFSRARAIYPSWSVRF
jgi:hypothetical protein